jgi:hypothetical protein
LDESITHLKRSKLLEGSGSRSVVNINFCDRLEALKDPGAGERLHWLAGVSLAAESLRENVTISGRADWVLAHAEGKAASETTLVVLCVFRHLNLIYMTANPPSEAKKGAAKLALPQLVIYLAAIQDARKKARKDNTSVFGAHHRRERVRIRSPR